MSVNTSTADRSIHGSWSSRWVFILAATGSAVGLGNIWKFPYITGTHGGGAFVLVYLLCIALIGIPIMMAEVMIGRKGRQSPINTINTLTKEAKASPVWLSIGWIGALAAFTIMAFYPIVGGWSLAYVVESIQGDFVNIDQQQAGAIFDQLIASPGWLIFWFTLFLISTLYIVARGVGRGLELAVRWMLPLLIVIMAFLLIYTMFLGQAFNQGVHFLFHFDFSKINIEAILFAMGQAFFTLSLGMGAMIIYGAYMPRKNSISSTVCIVALFDTVIALVAGLVIFPIVFANGLQPSEGPGLMFVTIPLALGQMHFGQYVSTAFFILVAFAAWTSAISMIEPVATWIIEKFKFSRAKAIGILGILLWLVGTASALSLNHWSGFKLLGLTIFDLFDFVSANILLPLGGLLIALFAGWVMQPQVTQAELAMKSKLLYKIWLFLVRFLAPVAIFIVFVVNLWGAIAS